MQNLIWSKCSGMMVAKWLNSVTLLQRLLSLEYFFTGQKNTDNWVQL
jgi:hypothetical protein